MTAWQQWLDRPEKFWFRAVLFQIHFWVGAAVGAYIFLLSLSGSAIVYRNELAGRVPIEWLDGQRHRRYQSGGAVRDRCGHLVAGDQALAPKPDGRLADEFRADQLGFA